MKIDRQRLERIDADVRKLIHYPTARRLYFRNLTRAELDAYTEWLFERAIRIEKEIAEARQFERDFGARVPE